MSKSENQAALRFLGAAIKKDRITRALQAGQAVIESGLHERIPPPVLNNARGSIYKTRIGFGRRSAGGWVSTVIRVRRFLPAIALQIRITRSADGPKAARAMQRILREGH